MVSDVEIAPTAAIGVGSRPSVQSRRIVSILLKSKIDTVSTVTTTYRMWQRLDGLRTGSRLFSLAAVARVPYFASVLPHVRRMEPGFAEVDVPNWFFVHNHLHTVHAIASCNAAEMAMGMLMEATVPTSHRWIPKAMNVQYLAKATTSLRATARIDLPDFDAIREGTEIVVPVSVVDRSGTEVVHADITTWVTLA